MSALARGVVVTIVVAACGRHEAIPLSPELPLVVKVRARAGALGRGPDPCPRGSSRTHPDRCPLADDQRDHLRAKVFHRRGDVMRMFIDAQDRHMKALWHQRAVWAAAGFQMRSIQVADDLSRNLRDPYTVTDADLRFDVQCFERLTCPIFVAQWDRYIATLRTGCR